MICFANVKESCYLEKGRQLILGCPERNPRLEIESDKKSNVGSDKEELS